MLLGILVVMISPIQLSAKLFGVLLIGGIASHGLRTATARSQLPVIGYRNGIWTLRNGAEVLDVSLLDKQFVTAWLIVLRMKDSRGKRHQLLIPGDSLSKEQHRELRRRLLDRPSFG